MKNNRNFLHSILTLAMSTALLAPGLASAEFIDDVSDKNILFKPRVETPAASDFKVSLSANKTAYNVNEPITLKVNGSEDFYLYLFSISSDTGKAVMILPNRDHKGNKYTKKQTFLVPNKNIQFFADRAGTERLVMIASKTYLNWDSAGYKVMGNFASVDLSTWENQMSKSIGYRLSAQPQTVTHTKNDLVVSELLIDVKDANASLPTSTSTSTSTSTGALLASVQQALNAQHAAAPSPTVSTEPVTSEASPVVFVSTDRPQYHSGEDIRFVAGADRAGWIHLFLEQDGKIVGLSRDPVDGKGFNTTFAKAVYPHGRHALIALYTQDKQSIKPDMVKDWLAQTSAQSSQASAKGLLITAKKKPFSGDVHYFHVSP